MSRIEQPKKLLRQERDKAHQESSPFKYANSNGFNITGAVVSKAIRKNRAAASIGLEVTKSMQYGSTKKPTGKNLIEDSMNLHTT